MASPIGRILRQSTQVRPYNILTACTHEAAETALAKTGHNFYAFPHKQSAECPYVSFKHWETKFRPKPDNYTLLDSQQLPIDLDFDFVLSQNKFGMYQILSNTAKQLNLPLISLEHTLSVPNWNEQIRENCKNMRGHMNVFISDMSVEDWRFSHDDPTVRVINHCVDTAMFNPGNELRTNQILTINNDFIGRDYCLNYSQFRRVTQGLPTKIVGDTKGLSLPAANVDELVSFYQTSSVFLNTAHLSPIPTVLLEAAACECAIVSCNTCAIPTYFTHNDSALLYNNDKEAREYLELFLNKPELAREFGVRARQRMIEHFSEQKFISAWNGVFDEAANIVYRG